MTLETGFDFRGARFGFRLQQAYGAHNHASRAIATLQGVFDNEGFLYWVQLAVGLQAFNGGDLFAFSLFDGDEAGADGFAIQQHCACAALPFSATVLGAGEAQFFSQCVQQRPVGSTA